MTQLQHPRPFTIPPEVLETAPADADRFVYAPVFVRFDPYADLQHAHAAGYQLLRAALLETAIDKKADREALHARYKGLAKHVKALAPLREEMTAQPTPSRQTQAAQAALDEVTSAVEKLGNAVAAAPPEASRVLGDVVDGMANLAQAAKSAAHEAGTPSFSGPGAGPGSGGYVGVGPPSTNVPPGTGYTDPGETIQAILESDLGFMFLDRTRIRPMGFALGEHLYSFSLAPGEEVTLEQHTYAKKEESFEQSSEEEKTFDTELSSTLATELNEGMTAEQSRNSTGTDTLGANVGGNIDGITFNVGPTTSSSVTDASRATVTSAVKSTQSTSSKVAARNRAQHKTVFKLSTETRFETSAKRIVRNPNANTPIDLQYFKVMQRLQLAHERYGVRLCWSPVIADPGAAIWAQFEAVHDQIYALAAQAGAGDKPQPPQPPGQTPPSSGPSQVVTDSVVADKFDPVWGGQRYDYQVALAAPAGYQWDGDGTSIANSLMSTFTGSRPSHFEVTSTLRTPVGVTVVVHVGIEDCRNPFKSAFWEATGSATFTVSAGFVPVPPPPAAQSGAAADYAQQLAAWQQAVATWEALDKQLKDAAKATADEQWATYLKAAIARIDPVQAVIAAVVRSFLGTVYDVSVIDFLEDVFDWKNAGLRLYADWWTTREPRDPDGAPNSFLNASWARLYLCVKPGAEAQALRWIYEGVTSGVGSGETERLVKLVESQLDGFRLESFGSADEIAIATSTDGGCPDVTAPYLCLGRWEETLPTDGTHLEVMQATSTAADDYARASLEDENELREAKIHRAKDENALVEKSTTAVGEVTATVNVEVGGEPESPST